VQGACSKGCGVFRAGLAASNGIEELTRHLQNPKYKSPAPLSALIEEARSLFLLKIYNLDIPLSD
jgi:hypothetical protein